MSMQQELRGTVFILFHWMISFPDLFISYAVPQTLIHKICHLMCQAEDKQRYGIPAAKYFSPSLQLQRYPSARTGPDAAALPLPSRYFPINQYWDFKLKGRSLSKVHSQRQGYCKVKITAITCATLLLSLTRGASPRAPIFVCSLAPDSNCRHASCAKERGFLAVNACQIALGQGYSSCTLFSGKHYHNKS